MTLVRRTYGMQVAALNRWKIIGFNSFDEYVQAEKVSLQQSLDSVRSELPNASFPAGIPDDPVQLRRCKKATEVLNLELSNQNIYGYRRAPPTPPASTYGSTGGGAQYQSPGHSGTLPGSSSSSGGLPLLEDQPLVNPVQAGNTGKQCCHPNRPCVESGSGVTRMNYFPENYRICFNQKMWQCTAGDWVGYSSCDMYTGLDKLD